MTKREMTIDDFDLASKIRLRRYDLKKARYAWIKERASKDQNLDQLEASIQEECKHWFTTYHGDPSGGSDSFDECQICGKQGKNLS